LYFKSFFNPAAGVKCRDGGIRDNNPVQIAVNESRAVWDDKSSFDVVLSVGAGTVASGSPPSTPSTVSLLPEWVVEFFMSLMQQLNGEEAWDRFHKAADLKLRLRSRRLNVRFTGSKEPGLDAVDQIDRMLDEASKHHFITPDHPDDAVAIIPHVSNGISEVALRLRASLFFFEPELVSYNPSHTVVVVKGRICCRLGSETDALRKLIDMMDGFVVSGLFVAKPTNTDVKPVQIPVAFQQVATEMENLIRIDAKFGGYSVPITGFPVAVKVSGASTRPISHCRMVLTNDFFR
jgi:hypothetical protein